VASLLQVAGKGPESVLGVLDVSVWILSYDAVLFSE